MPGELDAVGEAEEGGEFDPADLFDEPGGVVVEESAGAAAPPGSGAVRGAGPGLPWGGLPLLSGMAITLFSSGFRAAAHGWLAARVVGATAARKTVVVSNMPCCRTRAQAGSALSCQAARVGTGGGRRGSCWRRRRAAPGQARKEAERQGPAEEEVAAEMIAFPRPTTLASFYQIEV